MLPSTGGTGRMSYYLSGSLLMIISAILLKKKNK
ncbi:MAG: LPXTG cell wall anchor domain-containing protein [Erysipelotrichaceae bacterium]|nr:LPXTG cell wall anchor domain-containing protein [Erysipelotrichaceae bacterium]